MAAAKLCAGIAGQWVCYSNTYRERSQYMLAGRMRRLGVVALAMLAGWFCVRPATAAPTPEQSEKFRAAESALTKGETLYKNGKLIEAAAMVQPAQKALAELAEAKELVKQLQPLARRLMNLHDNLAIEGAKVPAISAAVTSLADLAGEKPMAKPAGEKPSTTPSPNRAVSKNSTPSAKSGAGAISFTKQVAPLLVAKCGKCHVTAAKGQFSMATFTSLMRGNKDGPVVLPNKGNGSRIVEVIESGDMPRGGGQVAKDELAMLVRWIDQGAKFDGANLTDSIAGLGAPNAATMATEPALSVVAATGKESVLFSRDIAPVLAEQCMVCHGTQNNPGGQLRLETFTALLRGGASGVCVQPGNPAASLIVRKIKGLSGDRMPKGKPPLSAAVVAKFEKWVAEGAKFDGYDPGQTMDVVAATYIAGVSTPEQLAAARAQRARRIWHLAIPDENPLEKETKNFLVMGNVGPEKLDEIATAAEKAAATIARIYHAPEDKPLVKGKITLFVCNQRFDYSEFGKMVEEREIPASGRGHFRYDVVNAYGAIVPPNETEYSLAALVG
ncbi:MAG TPA: c-type cytochrome domain-containing protein, partial [Pirellulales bacterium]|nr:c-type cytochrome domain-containing protein [Pirellulales bacterium]